MSNNARLCIYLGFRVLSKFLPLILFIVIMTSHAYSQTSKRFSQKCHRHKVSLRWQDCHVTGITRRGGLSRYLRQSFVLGSVYQPGRIWASGPEPAVLFRCLAKPSEGSILQRLQPAVLN